jgi:hypothetical protein
VQQKETSTMTPLELYGERKIEAVRELISYVTNKEASERKAKPPTVKTFADAIYAACEIGHFKEHLALWAQWPLRVEAYDEYNQGGSLKTIAEKYGVPLT